jgi:type I restriction enzyme, S subunit
VTELPPGWAVAPLELLVDVLDSERIPINGEARAARVAGKSADQLYPYYGATGQVGVIDDFLFDEPLILLGEDGVSFLDASRNKAYRVSGKYWVNNHAHVLRPRSDRVNESYLLGYLNSFDYRGSVTGTTRLKLTQAAMNRMPVPLAPRNEQDRIAALLDATLSRIASCRGRLARIPQILKRFREAVLEAAVTGKLTEEWRASREVTNAYVSFDSDDSSPFRDYAIPSTWMKSTLADLAQISGGITKDSKKQDAGFSELPYLRVANVQRGFLDLSEMKTIRVPPERVEELLLTPGDILFTEGGDLDKLGRGCVWEGQIERCVFQNHVFRARLKDERFSPRFFSHFSNSRGYQYFLAFGKQTTNLASINKSVLSSLPVPVPSIDEQNEIVRRVDELLALANNLERRYRDAVVRVETLSASILAKAFRGELVPQHSSDEPAAHLLERIRAASRSSSEKELAQGHILDSKSSLMAAQ